ncbi:MAG: PHB depolymerase family esterase [Flavobacteriales bacterium]|nr:PHB depolymerase family esterase [Flavobacteriales bacterium]
MRFVLTSILLLIITLCLGQNGEQIIIKDLNQNPGNLKGSIYIPEKLENNSRKQPLVVLLHGCNQTPDQLLSITGFQKYADSLGFYLLMPEQKMINNPSKCFNWFYEKDISHQQDGESRSIVAMIDYAEGNYPVDIYSIHIVGLSAGAAMANALMYHFPNVFASGAVVAGGPVGLADNPIDAMKVLNGKVTRSEDEYIKSCSHCKMIRRFPKVLLVHGTNDIIVDPTNLTEAAKQWKGILKYDIYDSIGNSRYLENDRLETNIYMDSSGHELLKTVTIKNMGHKYPQDRGDCYGLSGDDGMHAEDIDYNLTLDIIHFFGLNPGRIKPHRLADPNWDNKYVALKRYCDNTYYELETSKDTCQEKKFVNYTLSEMNGCLVPDYYYIYR